MQVQQQKLGKTNKIYIKGSGTSGCLLTGNLQDQSQFIELEIKDRQIVEIRLSGLFAIALVKPHNNLSSKQKQFQSQEKENILQVMKWGTFNNIIAHQPTIVKFPHNIKINAIDCGWNHTLFKTSTGKLFGMGENKYGQLGFHNPKQFINEPISLIQEDQKQQMIIETLAAGFRQSYWTTSKGKVYGCGQSKNYELGISNKKQIIPITQILFSNQNINKNIHFIKMVCGKKFMIVLNELGEIYGVGTNQHKCLIEQNVKQYQKLTKIGENMKDIACGWSHCLFVDKQDKVRSRGRNNFGQLGRKQSEQQKEGRANIPEKCVKIAAGTQFNFAKGISGQLYGWGWNEHMNIVNHHNHQIIHNPILVPTPSNFVISQFTTYPAITIIQGIQR